MLFRSPFGKKYGVHKGCTETVQAYDAWKAAALGANIFVTPVDCAIVHNNLSTKLMTHTYAGFTGEHYPKNKFVWTDDQFIAMFNRLIDGPTGPPMVPRLMRSRYPWLFEKLRWYEQSQMDAQPKRMPKAAREKLTSMTETKSEDRTIVVTDTESEWGPWSQNDPSKNTLEQDASEASPSGDHQGASPVGQALKPIPRSWKDNRFDVWNKHTELIQLGERETAYLSANTILLERANDLFGDALLNIEAAKSVSDIEWPLPPVNADGTKIEEDAEPFDQVQWDLERHVIVGGTDEQDDPEHDGFLIEEQLDAQYFESDRYREYPGFLGRATADVQGYVHASGLQILSLAIGDVIVFSFPLARNLAEEIAQTFTEEDRKSVV